MMIMMMMMMILSVSFLVPLSFKKPPMSLDVGWPVGMWLGNGYLYRVVKSCLVLGNNTTKGPMEKFAGNRPIQASIEKQTCPDSI